MKFLSEEDLTEDQKKFREVFMYPVFWDYLIENGFSKGEIRDLLEENDGQIEILWDMCWDDRSREIK